MSLRRIYRASISAGLLSGVILAILSFLIIEPIVDQALAYEENGHVIIDRSLQRTAGSVSWTLWGVIISCFFGSGYSLLANRLPGKAPIQKSLYLAAILFLVTVAIPQLKYPAWPPGVESQIPLMLRQVMRLTVLMGGAAIIAFAHILYRLLSRATGGRNIGSAISAALVASLTISFLVFYMPVDNPITIIPEALLTSFRVASVISQLIFWMLLGLLFGNFWSRRA